MPFFRLHNEKRLCTRLVINIKACTWCWHQSKGVCVPIFNVSTFMRKFRVLKIKSLFLSQVCTVVFLLSSSCESSDSSLLGFYRWSDIRSGYCVFFCSVAGKTRQNSINLYFCGGRYISSCPDDSTLLMITGGYQVCGRFERKWLGNG